MTTDLLFKQLPTGSTQPVELVFGESESISDAADIGFTLAAALPAPTLTAEIGRGFQCTVSAALPSPTMAANVAIAAAPVAATLAATLPLPALAVDLDTAVPVTLVAALPGLTLAAFVQGERKFTLDAVLPAPVLSGEIGDDSKILDTWVDGVLPPPVLAGAIGPPIVFTLEASTFPPITMVTEIKYVSGAERPLVYATRNPWQTAVQAESSVLASHQYAVPLPIGRQTSWQDAIEVEVGSQDRFQRAAPLPHVAEARHQDAIRAHNGAYHPYQDGLRDRRDNVLSKFQDGTDHRISSASRFQDGLRDRRANITSSYQEAIALHMWRWSAYQSAIQMLFGRTSKFQQAIVPRPGIWTRPVLPGYDDRCYIPPTGSIKLVFNETAGTTDLVFVCERAIGPILPTQPALVIVPIRSVYIVLNTIILRQVAGDIELPTLAMSLSLDVDSWTWGFSATLPASTLQYLEPIDGLPVELEASINGNLYRVLAEKITRERSFNKAAITVRGRGKNAILDVPYSPVFTFANEFERTIEQLMNDALLDNGVPIGWDVDFGMTNWLVPAGAWSHQGSRMGALTRIAEAAGGYIQPHATAQTVRILPKYPSAPWDWGSVTPDFELPSAVVTTEGIEWTDKAAYNRVFVSGQGASGILGQVTRQGTAGDILAPMVTDGLITHVDAARQRGLTILSDTGRQAQVSIKLPVLPETGIITPGKFVSYVDGATTRFGIVRSTQVETSGYPAVWQVLGVETHVA